MKNFENFTNTYKEFRFLPYNSFDFNTNQKILILNAYEVIKKNEKLFPYMQKTLTSKNETISLNVILLNNEAEKELFEFLLKIGNSFNIDFENKLYDLNYKYSDKILNNLNLYVPNFKKIISYDLDGVLHKSIIPGTIHPTNYYDYNNFIPNLEIIEKLNKESKNHDIIILTSRQNYEIPDLWEFVKKWNINITDIFTTDGDRIKKSYVLKSLKAIKHYDDNIAIKNDVEKNGIKFGFINTNNYF
ncbi:hypothetical protein M0Q97_10645 [Candidatus Dojkabacteria bacterium]|jgi:hypothetical protein|nr:hypothetical protein [Candidatus Dojkabacteria bacterium]